MDSRIGPRIGESLSSFLRRRQASVEQEDDDEGDDIEEVPSPLPPKRMRKENTAPEQVSPHAAAHSAGRLTKAKNFRTPFSSRGAEAVVAPPPEPWPPGQWWPPPPGVGWVAVGTGARSVTAGSCAVLASHERPVASQMQEEQPQPRVRVQRPARPAAIMAHGGAPQANAATHILIAYEILRQRRARGEYRAEPSERGGAGTSE